MYSMNNDKEVIGMSNDELVEKYCFNCEVGLYNCKYNLRECPTILSSEAGEESEERGDE